MKWIGADGCRSGWFAVVFDQDLSWDVDRDDILDSLAHAITASAPSA